MKAAKSIFILLICLLCFSYLRALEPDTALNIPKRQKPATIKVLLQKESPGILLEAYGPFQVINPENGKKLSSGHKGKRFYLYPHKEGIKWGEDFLGIFQLQIVPRSPSTTFLVNGIQHRGTIEIYHVEEKLNVINEIDIESFLKNTLSQNFPENYPNSVMDAIAIIARTDAYHNALLGYGAFWHVDAQVIGYEGMGLTCQNLAVEQAVDNTRHLVMTFEGRPFPATWTENCGGKTAPYQTIFRKATSTPQGTHSIFANKQRKETHWTLAVNTQDLAKVAKTNRVTGIDLFVDHFSNKIYAIRIHDGVHTEDIDFLNLQKYLGEQRLKSNDFTVSLKGDIATFEGYGRGIGVGLCLYSASQMSDRGDVTPHILANFFPHTHIEKMPIYPKELITTSQNALDSLKQTKPADKKYRILN